MNKVNLNSVYNKEEDYKPIFSPTHGIAGQSQGGYDKSSAKLRRMVEEDPIVDLEALKKAAWQGVPHGNISYIERQKEFIQL